MARAIFKYLGEVVPGLTKDREYPGFELFNCFQTIDDDGCFRAVGLGSKDWRLEQFETDDVKWVRPQPDEGKATQQEGTSDGEKGSGGGVPEGGQASAAEDGAEAGKEDRKSGKGRADKG